MAGTVSTDLGFFLGTSGGGSQSDCDQTTDWAPAPDLDSEIFIEGAGSLSEKVSKATYTTVFSLVGSLDLSDKLIFAWMNCLTPSQLNTKANGGLRIGIDSGAVAGSDYGDWYVGGKDTYAGGWECFVVRTNQAFDASTGSPDKSSVDHIRITCDTSNSAVGAAKNNFLFDGIRYGTYVQIYAGTEGSPATFDDFITAEDNNSYGAFIEKEGILMYQSKVYFGSTSAGVDTYFKDVSKVSVARVREFGGTYYNMLLQGNSTGDTQIYFGDKSGDAGISGCTFRAASGSCRFDLTATDAYIDNLGIYGCAFYDADSISFPAYSGSISVLNTNFETCGEILASGCTIKNSNFINADDRGVTISTVDHHVTDCNFISCPHAVNVSTSGSITFDNLKFTGNTYDIEFSCLVPGSTLTVNCTNGSNPTNYEITGSGSSVSIVNVVSHKLTGVKQNSEVTYVSGSETLFHVENVGATGETEYQYNYAGDKTVDILVHHVNYTPESGLFEGVILGDSNATMYVYQVEDPFYKNP